MKVTSTILVFAFGMTGCAAADSGSSSTDVPEVVVETRAIANKVTVFADRLEFDADLMPKLEAELAKVDAYAKAADKQAVEPVFFVNTREAGALDANGAIKKGLRNPLGYLRRAISWQPGAGGTIVVKTEPATLAETTAELARNGLVELSDKGIKTQADGVFGEGGNDNVRTWKHAFGGVDGFRPIDLSGKKLWEKQFASGTNASLVLKKGKIQIKPVVDTSISVKKEGGIISRFIPQSGQSILTTDVLGEVEFEANATGTFDMDQGETLFEQTFGGTSQTGMPLSLTVKVGWNCELGASGAVRANVGAVAKGQLKAGASFEGFSLSPVLEEPTYSFTRIGPTISSNATVNGACHLRSELSMQLFDAAGPTASVDLYSKLNATASSNQLAGSASATLVAGATASVGGSLRPFGIKIASIEAQPFTVEKEIFNGTISTK